MRTANNITTEITMVDPEKAENLLVRNIRNRTLDIKTVNRYADIMTRGEWRENYEPIQISDGGVLLNGQHRLKAIIKSGVPQKLMIVRGIDDSAMDSYDRLKVRSTSDIMSLHNVENSKVISSIIKTYLILKSGKLLTVKSGVLSNSKLKNYSIYDNDFMLEYEKNGDLFQELYKKSRAINQSMKGLFTVSEMAAYMAYLIIDKKHSPDYAIGFFKRVSDISDVSSMPILLLREKLIKSKMGNMKLQSRTKKAYIAKSWNAFVQNKDMKALMVREIEEVPDFI